MNSNITQYNINGQDYGIFFNNNANKTQNTSNASEVSGSKATQNVSGASNIDSKNYTKLNNLLETIATDDNISNDEISSLETELNKLGINYSKTQSTSHSPEITFTAIAFRYTVEGNVRQVNIVVNDAGSAEETNNVKGAGIQEITDEDREAVANDIIAKFTSGQMTYEEAVAELQRIGGAVVTDIGNGQTGGLVTAGADYDMPGYSFFEFRTKDDGKVYCVICKTDVINKIKPAEKIFTYSEVQSLSEDIRNEYFYGVAWVEGENDARLYVKRDNWPNGVETVSELQGYLKEKAEKEKKLDDAIARFTSGNMLLSSFRSAMEKIGITDFNNTTPNSNIYTVVFTFNDKKYTVICTREAASNGVDQITVETCSLAEIKDLSASDKAAYFEAVAYTGDDKVSGGIRFKLKEGVSLPDGISSNMKLADIINKLKEKEKPSQTEETSEVQEQPTEEEVDVENELKQAIEKFTSGNMLLSSFRSAMEKIGITDFNNTTKNSDIYTVVFTFNDKKYTVICTKEAASNGVDQITVKTYSTEDLQNLSEDVINTYFTPVAYAEDRNGVPTNLRYTPKTGVQLPEGVNLSDGINASERTALEGAVESVAKNEETINNFINDAIDGFTPAPTEDEEAAYRAALTEAGNEHRTETQDEIEKALNAKLEELKKEHEEKHAVEMFISKCNIADEAYSNGGVFPVSNNRISDVEFSRTVQNKLKDNISKLKSLLQETFPELSNKIDTLFDSAVKTAIDKAADAWYSGATVKFIIDKVLEYIYAAFETAQDTLPQENISQAQDFINAINPKEVIDNANISDELGKALVYETSTFDDFLASGMNKISNEVEAVLTLLKDAVQTQLKEYNVVLSDKDFTDRVNAMVGDCSHLPSAPSVKKVVDNFLAKIYNELVVPKLKENETTLNNTIAAVANDLDSGNLNEFIKFLKSDSASKIEYSIKIVEDHYIIDVTHNGEKLKHSPYSFELSDINYTKQLVQAGLCPTLKEDDGINDYENLNKLNTIAKTSYTDFNNLKSAIDGIEGATFDIKQTTDEDNESITVTITYSGITVDVKLPVTQQEKVENALKEIQEAAKRAEEEKNSLEALTNAVKSESDKVKNKQWTVKTETDINNAVDRLFYNVEGEHPLKTQIKNYVVITLKAFTDEEFETVWANIISDCKETLAEQVKNGKTTLKGEEIVNKLLELLNKAIIDDINGLAESAGVDSSDKSAYTETVTSKNEVKNVIKFILDDSSTSLESLSASLNSDSKLDNSIFKNCYQAALSNIIETYSTKLENSQAIEIKGFEVIKEFIAELKRLVNAELGHDSMTYLMLIEGYTNNDKVTVSSGVANFVDDVANAVKDKLDKIKDDLMSYIEEILGQTITEQDYNDLLISAIDNLWKSNNELVNVTNDGGTIVSTFGTKEFIDALINSLPEFIDSIKENKNEENNGASVGNSGTNRVGGFGGSSRNTAPSDRTTTPNYSGGDTGRRGASNIGERSGR